MENKKIAICFWGLTRSLKHTISSLKKNIFEILDANNIKYDIYIHTYILATPYINNYSGEINVELDSEEYKLLNPFKYQIDDQNLIKSTLNLLEYRTHPDPWNTNYETCDNFILALYSKFQVTNLVISSNINYDNIMFVRPDVKILTPLDINWLNISNINDIYTPIFDKHLGLNDRFFLSNYRNGIIYGNAFLQLKEYSKSRNIHSETYCKFYLEKLYKLHNIDINFYFNRVRATGLEINDSNLL